jgi:Ca2+-transporting ATPase
VGIAMGKSGTEVTKEAADVILADDNYASIVAGIHEGRGIYENIRKTLVYRVAGNTTELFVMLVAGLVGLPVPLLPLQLLWINLLSDGFPALAMVMDPAEPGLMTRPPRPPKEPMLGGKEWRHVVLTAIIEGGVVLWAFDQGLQRDSLEGGRSWAFTTLVLSEAFRAFAARSRTKVFWETGVTSNLVLLGVVILTFFLQIGLHSWEPTKRLFELSALHADDLVQVVLLSLLPATVLEILKLVRRGITKLAPG